MKVSELVSEDLILPDLKAADISGVLREFSETIFAAGKVSDPEVLFNRLYERELQGSTGIGKGVAIPHCKADHLQEVVLAIGYSNAGIDFKSFDQNPIYFFFVLVSPVSSSVLHLRALASLSRLLKSPTFLSRLQQRPSKPELIALIRAEEEAVPVK